MFHQPIIAEPNNVVKFTKAAVALHNYLRTEEAAIYCPSGYVDEEDGYGNIVRGAWRSDGSESNTGLSPIGGSSIAGNRCVVSYRTFLYVIVVWLCPSDTAERQQMCEISLPTTFVALLVRSAGRMPTLTEFLN